MFLTQKDPAPLLRHTRITAAPGPTIAGREGGLPARRVVSGQIRVGSWPELSRVSPPNRTSGGEAVQWLNRQDQRASPRSSALSAAKSVAQLKFNPSGLRCTLEIALLRYD